MALRFRLPHLPLIPVLLTVALGLLVACTSASVLAGPAGKVGSPAPEFEGIANWINSEPLTMKELRGKVVLIDFWTYTCVNCIRTMPYLKEWHDRYADKGLVIAGVHSPEFEFEKLTGNVVESAQDFGLSYTPSPKTTIWVLGGHMTTGPGPQSTWWTRTESSDTYTLEKAPTRKLKWKSAGR